MKRDESILADMDKLVRSQVKRRNGVLINFKGKSTTGIQIKNEQSLFKLFY